MRAVARILAARLIELPVLKLPDADAESIRQTTLIVAVIDYDRYSSDDSAVREPRARFLRRVMRRAVRATACGASWACGV